ncbi:unnamed protein product [Moneuplotes crassus]|uniref:Uncharacterized protein n=1 Tax=Euplotes crassus TaxID=5936 RepID=A0AAD1Y6V6_EUPCR|nr:unnamed protein product [Moneuplotes crassus]
MDSKQKDLNDIPETTLSSTYVEKYGCQKPYYSLKKCIIVHGDNSRTNCLNEYENIGKCIMNKALEMRSDHYQQ